MIYFAKTAENELTFSDTLDWDDERVYTSLMGLSLAAADSVLCVGRGKQQSLDQFRAAVEASMEEILSSICPRDERYAQYPPPRPQE